MDDKSEVISWRSKKDFSFLPKGDFPTEIATIATFFKGFRKKMHQHRRVYIKFGVHTTGDFDTLEKDLKEWTNLYSYTINRCLIQSDDAGFVGVLCYTLQFTDISMWRREMMQRTSYEWGLKWSQLLHAIRIYTGIND